MKGRNIGEKLKDERQRKGISIDYVSNETKIRKEYLEAIEKEDFSKFDSHVYAKGFIRNYARYLKLDENNLLAIYRRDYENVGMKRTTKKIEAEEVDQKPKKRLNIKNLKFTSRQISLSIFIIAAVVIILFIINLVDQAFKPPYIKVTSPLEITAGQTQELDYYEKTIVIKGETAPYTVVKINEVPIPLKSGFDFESDIFPITSDQNVFNITATSRLGVSSTIKFIVNKKINTTGDENINGLNGLITILNDETDLVVTADDKEIYNTKAFVNDTYPLRATNKIQIQASKPENIDLVLNGQSFKVFSPNDTFEIINNNIVQKSL